MQIYSTATPDSEPGGSAEEKQQSLSNRSVLEPGRAFTAIAGLSMHPRRCDAAAILQILDLGKIQNHDDGQNYVVKTSKFGVFMIIILISYNF